LDQCHNSEQLLQTQNDIQGEGDDDYNQDSDDEDADEDDIHEL